MMRNELRGMQVFAWLGVIAGSRKPCPGCCGKGIRRTCSIQLREAIQIRLVHQTYLGNR
jgi:hypothetical protein